VANTFLLFRTSYHGIMAKKALLISCNYPGTNAELKGCWNDNKIWKKILTDVKGFQEEDITILTDADPDYELPTGSNST
jgi:hypothetical protein